MLFFHVRDKVALHSIDLHRFPIAWHVSKGTVRHKTIDDVDGVCNGMMRATSIQDGRCLVLRSVGDGPYAAGSKRCTQSILSLATFVLYLSIIA